jgi:hypothetical protein
MWEYGGESGARGRFSSSTSVSPTNLYSTNFSTITIIRGWYNRLVVAAVPKVSPHKLKKKLNSMALFGWTVFLRKLILYRTSVIVGDYIVASVLILTLEQF